MENIYYEKMILEDFETENLTIKDFIKVCDTLELPVFEVEIIRNPFVEPHEIIKTEIYNSMSEFRKKMPDWSAREYDYENDRATYYIKYPGIADGIFDVNASNSSSSYHWHFEVVGRCVVVHTLYNILD